MTKMKRSMQTNVFFFPIIVIAIGAMVLGANAKHAADKGKLKLGQAPAAQQVNQATAMPTYMDCLAAVRARGGQPEECGGKVY